MPTSRSIKRTMADLADRLGYNIVPKWQVPELAMANRLRELFSFCGIKHVIDVGANKGQYYKFLRDSVHFRGPIDSFEPVPHLGTALQAASASDPHWRVHATALGAQAGTQRLNLASSTDFSSFLQPLANESFAGHNTVAEEVDVPVTTLDLQFPDAARLRNTFIKMDTQGYDLEVLKGGRGATSAIPLLQTEVSFRPIYHEMPSFSDSLKALNSLGYAIVDMFAVGSGVPAGGVCEFDLIMVREDLTRGKRDAAPARTPL